MPNPPKSFSWSYTNLTGFEQCPRRHYLTKVKREVKEPPSAEMTWGRDVHKALETRIRGVQALPPSLAYIEPLVMKFTSLHGRRLVEEKLAVDRNFKPCDWFHPQVWCRSVIDLGIVGEDNAVLIDWKTGKHKEDDDQLRLFAAMAFAHFPYLNRISTAFIWLKDKKMDSNTFLSEDVSNLWKPFMPRVQRMEMAFSKGEWPAKPSGLCGKWCPVTKAHCEFGR